MPDYISLVNEYRITKNELMKVNLNNHYNSCKNYTRRVKKLSSALDMVENEIFKLAFGADAKKFYKLRIKIDRDVIDILYNDRFTWNNHGHCGIDIITGKFIFNDGPKERRMRSNVQALNY